MGNGAGTRPQRGAPPGVRVSRPGSRMQESYQVRKTPPSRQGRVTDWRVTGAASGATFGSPAGADSRAAPLTRSARSPPYAPGGPSAPHGAGRQCADGAMRHAPALAANRGSRRVKPRSGRVPSRDARGQGISGRLRGRRREPVVRAENSRRNPRETRRFVSAARCAGVRSWASSYSLLRGLRAGWLGFEPKNR